MSTPELVLNILQDDFAKLLDKERYDYIPWKNKFKPEMKRKLATNLGPGLGELVFAHSDPLKNLDDYLKLKAQCDYLRRCLNTDSDLGYIMSISFGPYEKHKEALVGIRKIIPKNCKFFVCRMEQGQNFEPTLTEDDIYYGAVDIGDGWAQGSAYADDQRVRAYGESDEYTKMIDKIFY
jgi:hypothetical protein